MSIEKLKNLIQVLNKASEDYYNGNASMSDLEFDKLYDELKNLEKKYNIILPNSPTQKVGFEIPQKLKKEKHEKSMLSLDKTKDRNVLKDFLNDKKGILSYKMDGLTIVLTYENGNLVKAVTRGNGEVGEIITENAKYFENLPLHIEYKKHLVLRGEAIISYSDFKKINDSIPLDEEKYKNPRNLCSGALRQLDPKMTKERHVKFFAFNLVEYEKKSNEELNKKKHLFDLEHHFKDRLDFLQYLGFTIVLYKEVNSDNILDTIEWFSKDVILEDYPSDGLVLIFDDILYGESLGHTSKFPKNALAFKWKDEVEKTILRDIEWSPSRTGLINPVAIFDPVQLEGTIVKRASLHNISIMKELQIGIGDEIEVYKANMIIPQVANNITKSGKFNIPNECPICNTKTKILSSNGVETLHCINNKCPIKHLKKFELFVSRNAINIEGLNIATLDTFIEHGFIKEYADIFHLNNYKEKIIELDGFGEKSYENIIKAIEDKREVELSNLINSLGIMGIGIANSKILAKYYDYDINKLLMATKEELNNIDEIGPILSDSLYDYFHNEDNIKILNNLLKEIKIIKHDNIDFLKLKNKTFVITGSLTYYKNRDTLIELIEKEGGKVTSSVTKNTNYLINNDYNSNSTKNKKARELGIKIIKEEDFKEMIK
ncbi:MAG: NAD-dependent DNA ligase LigA [Eubacteriales bacterium]|nr:NAD-dependent DNA ligase LigA [Eubacteriales bacterium]